MNYYWLTCKMTQEYSYNRKKQLKRDFLKWKLTTTIKECTLRCICALRSKTHSQNKQKKSINLKNNIQIKETPTFWTSWQGAIKYLVSSWPRLSCVRSSLSQRPTHLVELTVNPQWSPFQSKPISNWYLDGFEFLFQFNPSSLRISTRRWEAKRERETDQRGREGL